ncbi:MAG: SOS response-associated peptidase [Chitinophagia bacterium]|jgi:putative SOS response-associated peptidase YedK|nr:SOS response-associated peptidase [Chitinophagia bacterium]
MCYVIGVKVPKKQTLKIGNKHIDIEAIDIPAQSGFSYSKWPVLFYSDESKSTLEAGLMHWELIPHWVSNEKELNESRKKYTTLNIKGENILSNKVAGPFIIKKRCLVLASHFFEWQQIEKEKIPHCISLQEQNLFYIAGVWNIWTNRQTGDIIPSFGIITTEANEMMSKIHNTKKRMPTILDDDLAAQWINSNLSEKEVNSLAIHQFKTDKMKSHTVAKNFQQSNDPSAPFNYQLFTSQSLF